MPNVFATEIAKNITAQKVVIAEVDIGREIDFWINSSPGVWIVNFLDAYSKLTTFTTVPNVYPILIVGGVTIDGAQLSRVTTPLAVKQIPSSFYYESGTRTLYLHLTNCSNPRYHKIRVGQVYGFRKGGDCASYGGVDFQDRLLEAPSFSLNKDPTFFGVLTLDSTTFKIANHDGEYDLLTRNEYVFGNKGRVLIGFDGWALSEFQQIFEGMIGKITTDEENITVEVRDNRASLSKAIPENIFTTSDYPNLNENDIGKPIPRVFGTVRNAPVYVIDQDQSTAQAPGTTVTYHVKISDTEYTSAINDIVAVYVNGNYVLSTDEDLGLREFTLIHTTDTNDQYSPGDEVTADLIGEVDNTGSVIENGAEVIRKLLLDYYGFSYSNDFYNLSKWDELQAKNIGLWLGENQEAFIDIISLICSEGIQADFWCSGDGRYCLRIWNENRASIKTIYRNQILNTPKISDDPTKTITSALIGYRKDWANNEYWLFLNDDHESTIFNKYPVYNQVKFDSLMVNSTDAYDYSENIFDKSSDVETIIELSVPGWLAVELEIGDIVIAHVNRKTTDWYKRCKCEVIGTQRNFNDHIVSLTLRLIQRLDDVQYTRSWFYSDNEDVGYLNYYCSSTQEQHIYYGMTINEA